MGTNSKLKAAFKSEILTVSFAPIWVIFQNSVTYLFSFIIVYIRPAFLLHTYACIEAHLKSRISFSVSKLYIRYVRHGLWYKNLFQIVISVRLGMDYWASFEFNVSGWLWLDPMHHPNHDMQVWPLTVLFLVATIK